MDHIVNYIADFFLARRGKKVVKLSTSLMRRDKDEPHLKVSVPFFHSEIFSVEKQPCEHNLRLD